ncbi:transmembrane protein 183-like [Clytia hemisphaerica]
MTKKSKKKSLKTGHRTADEPRSSTFCVGHSHIIGQNITPQEATQNPTKRLTKAERKRLQKQRIEYEIECYHNENNKRIVYPTDLWFLIGRHVKPECVKTFTLICRDAYKVTCTRKFWLELYKRNIRDFKELPSHLKPNAINTNVGLKTRVVRSLFFAYKPFVGDNVQRVPMADAPNDISRDKLVETHWWQKMVSAKNPSLYVWRLHIKLIKVTKNRFNRRALSGTLNTTELIHQNPDRTCSILQVTAPSYMEVPPTIFGMCLTNISIGLSSNMKSHKVRLFFHEYRPYGPYHDSQANVLLIDPAFDVQYLNWWDSEYPHPYDK